MDKDKALKLALEFVENVHLGEWQGSTERQEEIVTAINKALAQPAQEPVVCCQQYDTCLQPCTPRGEYLAQRPWVGLTDDEVYKIAFVLEGEHWRKIADAIEAKLKDKNNG